jgi:hypothetical protein
MLAGPEVVIGDQVLAVDRVQAVVDLAQALQDGIDRAFVGGRSQAAAQLGELVVLEARRSGQSGQA